MNAKAFAIERRNVGLQPETLLPYQQTNDENVEASQQNSHGLQILLERKRADLVTLLNGGYALGTPDFIRAVNEMGLIQEPIGIWNVSIAPFGDLNQKPTQFTKQAVYDVMRRLLSPVESLRSGCMVLLQRLYQRAAPGRVAAYIQAANSASLPLLWGYALYAEMEDQILRNDLKRITLEDLHATITGLFRGRLGRMFRAFGLHPPGAPPPPGGGPGPGDDAAGHGNGDSDSDGDGFSDGGDSVPSFGLQQPPIFTPAESDDEAAGYHTPSSNGSMRPAPRRGPFGRNADLDAWYGAPERAVPVFRRPGENVAMQNAPGDDDGDDGAPPGGVVPVAIHTPRAGQQDAAAQWGVDTRFGSDDFPPGPGGPGDNSEFRPIVVGPTAMGPLLPPQESVAERVARGDPWLPPGPASVYRRLTRALPQNTQTNIPRQVVGTNSDALEQARYAAHRDPVYQPQGPVPVSFHAPWAFPASEFGGLPMRSAQGSAQVLPPPNLRLPQGARVVPPPTQQPGSGAWGYVSQVRDEGGGVQREDDTPRRGTNRAAEEPSDRAVRPRTTTRRGTNRAAEEPAGQPSDRPRRARTGEARKGRTPALDESQAPRPNPAAKAVMAAAVAAGAVKRVAGQAAKRAAANAPTPAEAASAAATAAIRAADAASAMVARTAANTVLATKRSGRSATALAKHTIAAVAPIVNRVVSEAVQRGRRASSAAKTAVDKTVKNTKLKVNAAAEATGSAVRAASRGLAHAADVVQRVVRRTANRAKELVNNPQEIPDAGDLMPGRRTRQTAPGRRTVAKADEAEQPPRAPARFNRALRRANSFEQTLRPPNPKYPRINLDLPRQPRNWRGIKENEREQFAESDRKKRAMFASMNARRGRKTGGNMTLRNKLELSSPILPYDHLANDGYYIKY